MPWSPDWSCEPDPALNPFRDRVAALIREGEIVGHVLFVTSISVVQTGGELFWRRWTPACERMHPIVRMRDGAFFDGDDEPDDEELAEWRKGRFPLLGERLELRWLTEDEALAEAPAIFGVTACHDNDGKVIWSNYDL